MHRVIRIPKLATFHPKNASKSPQTSLRKRHPSPPWHILCRSATRDPSARRVWRCSRFACLSVNIGEFAFPMDPLGEEMDKVNDGGEEEERAAWKNEGTDEDE